MSSQSRFQTNKSNFEKKTSIVCSVIMNIKNMKQHSDSESVTEKCVWINYPLRKTT